MCVRGKGVCVFIRGVYVWGRGEGIIMCDSTGRIRVCVGRGTCGEGRVGASMDGGGGV